MPPPPDFLQWALSPDLNIEEAFCAEVLTEHGLEAWKLKNKVEDPSRYDYDLGNERYRLRRLNPAHRAELSEIDVMRAAEMLPFMTKLDHFTHGRDRDLRDLSGLRFCPRLTELRVAPTELPHLEWLRFVPELEDLWLQDDMVEDYSALAFCPKLKKVHFWLSLSWCDLRALAQLPVLEEVTLHANLPTLANVGPLEQVRKVYWRGFGNGRAFLRNASDLPDMPRLREANIVPWARLDGIEKFSALEELTVEGSFLDLAPLARLPNLHKLILGGERFTDLSPLAHAPKLALLQICREMPVDYTPLLESSSLRELLPRYGYEPTPEMVGLNAALLGWETDYLLSEPRSLPEPVYRIVDTSGDAEGDGPFASPKGKRVVGFAAPLHLAEGKWVARRLRAAIDRALGEKNWGKTDCSDYRATDCVVTLDLETIDTCERVPEVIEACRRELAWLRNQWVVSLTTHPLAEWEKDPQEWKDPEERELEDHIAEAQDYVERRRQYLAFLERLREYRLRQELGEKAPPEKFAPPKEEPKEEDSDLLDVGDEWERSDHPRWLEYFMKVCVSEDGVWGFSGFKGKNERLTGHTFEVPEHLRAKYEAGEE
jgi:hypothetical protein